jgi:O-antigen/teichoic acid export membrane protein
LAVLDQGLISGSNFLIGILLARWLLPAQYGAYGLAFEIFLLLSLLHQALLIEPQRVFGPSDYPDCLREYFGVLLWLHAGLAVVLLVALGISCWLLHELARLDNLSGALAGIAIAAPCILLLWLARSAYYVKISPQGAAGGAAVYCAIVLSSLLLVQRFKLISPFFVFLLMGFGALASSAVLLIRLKPVMKLPSRQMWRKVGEQHWGYGRWILASLVLSSISGGIYYPLVSSFSGLAATGQLKALLNFSLPVAQTLSALSVFFLPYASRVYKENGLTSLRGLIWKITWLFGTAPIAYWTFLILFSKPVLRLLYGGHYTELAPLIPWLAVGSLPWNLAAVPAIALRAVRSPVSIFGTYCASSIVAVLAGVPATWAFGLRGTLLAMMLSNLAALVVVIMLLRRKLRDASMVRP